MESKSVLRFVPADRFASSLLYWNESSKQWGPLATATRFAAEAATLQRLVGALVPNLPGVAGTAAFVDYLEDLDGFPYQVDPTIGPWRITTCCGAAVSIDDGPLYCKSCFGEVSWDFDPPARLDGDWRPNDGPVTIIIR